MLLISEQEHHLIDTLVQISSLYYQGLTQYEIADKLNVSQPTVQRVFKKLGLPKRKSSRSKETRLPRYRKFYYCVHCKWIPITKVTKNYCPECNGKLRKSKKSRNKSLWEKMR
jgi:transcriptional antiterminator